MDGRGCTLHVKRQKTHPAVAHPEQRIWGRPRLDRALGAVLIVAEYLIDLVSGGVLIDPKRLSVLMAAQHQEDLIVAADELVPDHLRGAVARVDGVIVDDRVGFALAGD